MKIIPILFLIFFSFVSGLLQANQTPTASQVGVNWEAFDKNLNSSDTTVQKALQTLDQLVAGGGIWGTITGTLSNQTDLQNALNAKQNSLTFYNLSGGTGLSITNGTGVLVGNNATISVGAGYYMPTTSDESNWNSKQNAITTGTTAQYFRGDLSLATFPTNVSYFTNDAGYLTSINWAGLTILNGTGVNWSAFYPTSNPFNYIASNQNITVSGDISGSGTTSITLTLPTVNNNVGTFQGIVVNAKGQVTGATNQNYLTGNQSITLSGPVTGSGTTSIATAISNQAIQSAGINWNDINKYPYLNSSGINWNDINKNSPINEAGINWTNFPASGFMKFNGQSPPTADTNTYLTANQSITLSGDLSGTGATSISTTLATVNSNIGTYQGITVNGKGLVTGAVNQNYLTGNQSITLTGAVTGSGTTSISTALANLIVQSANVNWNDINKYADLNSTGINWNNINGLSVVNSGGLNWNDINAHALLNNTGINWASMYAQTTTVNWSSAFGLPALDVFGTAQMTGFQLGTSTTSGYVLTANASGVGTWQVSSGGGGSNYWTLGAGNVGIGTSTNNVGIGTKSSLNTLNVLGNVGIGTFGYDPYLNVQTAPNGGMIVSGNVGIGTWLPNGKLQVSSTVSNYFGTNVGIGTWATQNGLDVSTNLAVGSAYAGIKSAPANGIISSGNIGIGTAIPPQALYVVGDIFGTGNSHFNGNLQGGITGNVGIGSFTASAATCDTTCNNNSRRCLFGQRGASPGGMSACSVSITGSCFCLPT